MKHRGILAGCLLACLIVLPRYLDSCSPAPPELRFTTYHNLLPADLAAGRLGIIRPEFRRRYLLLAYRDLSGIPVTADQIHPQVDPPAADPKVWLDARKLVDGAPAVDPIDPEKKLPGEDYQFFTNCLADSFANAAATLQKRVAQWGAKSPQAAEWLRGQDQVFRNCSAGPSIPPPFPAGDPLLAADRDYQIAAAEFYAGQYDKALADFDKIAANAASPWRDTARYVAARAAIRQGTMHNDPAKLRDAAVRLEAIGKDAGLPAWHAPAEALLGFVRAKLDPQQQLAALGNQLVQPGPPDRLERILADYTTIWDHRKPTDPIPPGSDVAHWIAAYQAKEPAIDVWRTNRTTPWLIAALAEAKSADAELIAAAHAVPPDSPAWDSATYYGILAQIRSGELDAARAWTDAAMTGKPTPATMNLLRSERMRLARGWTEFLRFAPRRPITNFSDEDEVEERIDDATLKLHPTALDDDSVMPLNHGVPLSLLVDASQNSLIPRNLQVGIAQAAWVRAVILGNRDSARTLAGRLVQLSSPLAPALREWLAEQDAAAAQFSAVFLMLRAPGLEPLLRARGGRETPVMRSDIFRDNWWLLETVSSDEPEHQALRDLYPDGHYGSTAFLPEAQRATAEKEWHQLTDRAENSVNYMCTQTLDWAHTHPEDPRVPQALYLAVEATHYGPSDKSSVYSHQAFDLLHRKYPNSEWTRKTKYWY